MSNYDNSKTVNILWTGGWDSTFSLLSLLDRDVIIQPHYIIDRQRNSYKKEIEVMDNIRAAILVKYPITLNSLRPTIYTELNSVNIDEEILIKHKNLQQDTGLGDQYNWIASYAKNADLNDLQMSIVKDGSISGLLDGFFERVDDGILEPYWKITNVPDDRDISILSYFHFPVLDYTKLDMLETSKKEGFFDILNLSWSCHKPINDEPCGICKPCIIAIESGLSWRLTPKAIRRYKLRWLYAFYSKLVIIKKKCKGCKG